MSRWSRFVAAIAAAFLPALLVSLAPSKSDAAPILAERPPSNRRVAQPILRVLPIPEPGARSGLDAIAMVRPGDLWAVGAYQTANSDLTLTVHLQGGSRTVVRSPNPSPGWAHFFGVAGKGANDVWAVGTYAPSNAGWPNLPFRALAEHWDGARWGVVPTPNLGGANVLFAVAVLGPDNVWAVGGYYNSKISFENLQCEHTAHTLVEHWNGRAWRVIASPDPGRNASFVQPCGPSHPLTSVNVLSGVAALGPRNVWAVGHYWDGRANRTLAVHWNGRRWMRVASPNSSAAENVLYGVATPAPRDIWAAGTYRPTPREPYRTLIERWNGRAWRVIPSPSVIGQDSQLYSIAARGRAVWAVGRHDGSGGGGLAERWDGARWLIVPSQKAGDCACSNALNGVAVGPDAVWTAGEFSGATIHKSLAEIAQRKRTRSMARALSAGDPNYARRR